MNDCLFCKIVSKEIPAEIVFENETVLGFKDINPKAKVHVLFIHKNHSRDVTDMPNSEIPHIFNAIKSFSKENSHQGFRIINNCGEKGGQSVFHTHFHYFAESIPVF